MLKPLALLVFVAGFWAAAHADEPEAPRVVSINLCADQYVLALAPKSQILGVSRLAKDRSISYLADEAAGIPTLIGAAEEVVELDPDLVITGAFTHRTTTQLLKRFGYPVIEVPFAESLDDVRAGIALIADALGQQRAGNALLEALRDTDPATPEKSHAPSILHYQARGFVTGSRSLLGDLLRRAGFTNMAGQLGIPSLGRASLETVVYAQPDKLLVDGGPTIEPGVGQGMPDHPAMDRVLGSGGRIAMPDALISCGGPSTAAALAFLTRARG